MEINVLDDLAFRMYRVMYLPLPDFENGLADIRRSLGITIRHFASDHVLDDAVFTDHFFVAVQRIDRGAVAQDRDRIRDLGNFIEFVRNQDRGNTLCLELQQQIQQGVAVAFIQAGGGFVEDQQLDLFR